MFTIKALSGSPQGEDSNNDAAIVGTRRISGIFDRDNDDLEDLD